MRYITLGLVGLVMVGSIGCVNTSQKAAQSIAAVSTPKASPVMETVSTPETKLAKATPSATKTASAKIAEGSYSIRPHTSLEVKGSQYRYVGELPTQVSPWKSVQDLRAVKQGVVFDGKNYWCLSSMWKGGTPACTANGWEASVR